ncbi:MAG: glycosyltransferase family 4 protein [Anaerolineales bacterium]|jgi:glycosyltransferase involved in cell wall biosynthesis
MRKLKRISILPYIYGVGGPASFRQRFSSGLERHWIAVTADLDDISVDAVLLISGWRQLGKLRRLKRRGIPIIQRLDGINWIHRQTRFNPRYYLKAEYGNWLMRVTRRHLASHIIYQSQFVQRRWTEIYGTTQAQHDIIYNSVDLDEFSPHGETEPKRDRQRIMVVEGSFSGGHDLGLRIVLEMAAGVKEKFGIPLEVVVAGRVPDGIQKKWESYAKVPVSWLGIVPRERIPLLNRSAALLFSAELNPACPNSVIEALACGLPVLGYQTGSLAELVTGDAGRVVPFQGDPWKLDYPEIAPLVDAAGEILQDQAHFRAGARQRAEEAFGLDKMVQRYVEVMQSI